MKAEEAHGHKRGPRMKQRKIKLKFIGPFADHDVLCWICNQKSAVYDMSPVWVFRPCYRCQDDIGRAGRILFGNKLNWFLMLFV